ncbi:nuclear transport factor 2 family protein [Nocardioides dongkuii]|uniref:nuclear transport factor 2 family protein n=1 Tax=Nocardioides dongkuii TaxID=2760089 RepID=UPI0015F7FC2E|nr:nuclear transport factor 2 family protein [Nocardioides dongkuii]
MADSAREIENLLYLYAERIDAGDFDGVADLFAHGRIHGQEGGPPGAVFEGRDAVRRLYGATTRRHDDGTPRTHHAVTNARIDVDEDAGTATCSSRYLVAQATPELPLQVIVTGRYRDTFHRLEGRWWFDTRTMYVDLVGDLSHHLPPGLPL